MARISLIHKTATSCTPSATIYATVAAWEASIDRATNGDETGVIGDDAAYAEQPTFNATASGTSICRLTANDGVLFTHIDGSAAPNVRGDGSIRSGARLDHTGTLDGILISTNYWVIDHINVIQRTTGNDDDCIQHAAALTGFAVINCNFEHTTTLARTDGIHLANGNHTDVLINGCSFFNMSRAGIHSYQSTTSGTHTVNFFASHNTFYQARGVEATTANAAAIKLGTRSSGGSATANLHNNVFGTTLATGAAIVRPLVDGPYLTRVTPTGTAVWNGDTNFSDGSPAADLTDIDGTNNLTNITHGSSTAGSTKFTTQASGNYAVLTNGTAGTADFRPLDDAAGNYIIGNGIPTADLPDCPNATIDGWWNTINGKGARDKRGYLFHPTTPDLGAYSYANNTAADIPFIAQGAHVS